jgi:hypothetical protein
VLLGLTPQSASAQTSIFDWVFPFDLGNQIAGPELVSDLPSGQTVGTPVTFTATWPDETDVDYRLTIRGGSPTVIRDFEPRDTFTWVPTATGLHQVTLEGRRRATGETASTTLLFDVAEPESLPAVSPTPHPLVALYSVRSDLPFDVYLERCGWLGVCRIRATYQAVDSDRVEATPLERLVPWGVQTFVIAGLRENTDYAVSYEILDEADELVSVGPVVEHRSGIAAVASPGATPDLPPAAGERTLLVQSIFGPPAMAFDDAGELVWYLPPVDGQSPVLQRITDDGHMLVSVAASSLAANRIHEVDLTGAILRSTTLGRINEQLEARGEQAILGFHHDVIALPGGGLAILAYVMRTLEDVQGPGPVDVLGDAVVVVDEDLQVTWSWNAFDHLDPAERAILDERCNAICPEEAKDATDWLHANGLSYSPGDGNLLLSVRHLDQVVKIGYEDGEGDGGIVWRLGQGGDFTIDSDDPWPWMSHQHDPNWLSGSRIVLYDNGNTRCEFSGDCESRGQVYELDEDAMTATLLLDARLGDYVFFIGSAQALRDGGYAFGSGAHPNTPPMFWSLSDAFGPDGAFRGAFRAETAAYRLYRLRDLYTPPSDGTSEVEPPPPDPLLAL